MVGNRQNDDEKRDDREKIEEGEGSRESTEPSHFGGQIFSYQANEHEVFIVKYGKRPLQKKRIWRYAVEKEISPQRRRDTEKTKDGHVFGFKHIMHLNSVSLW